MSHQRPEDKPIAWLEPQVQKVYARSPISSDSTALLSIAVSLKRIADAAEILAQLGPPDKPRDIYPGAG